ncbi:MAG: DUF2950 family protein [Planctomycetota bacterium]|jgi:hypothetical protein
MPTDERARHRRIGCAVGIVLIVLLVAAIVIPNPMASRIAPCEPVEVAALRAYVEAQELFRKEDHYTKGERVYANPVDGRGFADLYEVGGPGSGGRALGLIDRELAEATSPERARYGYYFVDITGGVDGPYDFSKQFGLCAAPAQYLRTGTHTYIVDARGRIFRKNIPHEPRARCEPVTTWPDVEKEGWLPVED